MRAHELIAQKEKKKVKMASIFTVCAAFFLVHSALATLPLVHVEEGAVKGTYETSAGGRKFAAFKGIPYARPPTGKYRFKEPVPVKRWPGVWNATEYGSQCLQYVLVDSSSDKRVSGSEDCLSINVFTPKLPTTATASFLLDVFVYIHGGAFMYGASSGYGPELLMDRDLVVVTFNYRLGILGFLSTEDDVVPGNNGLKDQVLALRWVQRNIAVFGGNPARVTIAGTSAGGASVHYHFLSLLSKGLFQAGMSFSGTALSPWAQSHGNREKADRIGGLMGCPCQSSRDLVDCLRFRPAELLVKQTRHFMAWQDNPFNPFSPTVEVAGNAPFLSQEPTNIILEGGALDLPWLTSITSEEGLFPISGFISENLLHDLDQNFNEIAPHLLFYNYTASKAHHKTISQKIRDFYLKDKPISRETIQELVKLTGDRTFVVDIEGAARMMASVNTAPVYFYKFNYRGADSLSRYLSHSNDNLGSAHADDAAYVMRTFYCNTETTDEDKAVSNLLLDICANFAKTSNPTPTKYIQEWSPLKASHKFMDYLDIIDSSHVEMKSSADLGNRKFWHSLPIEESPITAYKLHKYTDEL